MVLEKDRNFQKGNGADIGRFRRQLDLSQAEEEESQTGQEEESRRVEAGDSAGDRPDSAPTLPNAETKLHNLPVRETSTIGCALQGLLSATPQTRNRDGETLY